MRTAHVVVAAALAGCPAAGISGFNPMREPLELQVPSTKRDSVAASGSFSTGLGGEPLSSVDNADKKEGSSSDEVNTSWSSPRPDIKKVPILKPLKLSNLKMASDQHSQFAKDFWGKFKENELVKQLIIQANPDLSPDEIEVALYDKIEMDQHELFELERQFYERLRGMPARSSHQLQALAGDGDEDLMDPDSNDSLPPERLQTEFFTARSQKSDEEEEKVEEKEEITGLAGHFRSVLNDKPQNVICGLGVARNTLEKAIAIIMQAKKFKTRADFSNWAEGMQKSFFQSYRDWGFNFAMRGVSAVSTMGQMVIRLVEVGINRNSLPVEEAIPIIMNKALDAVLGQIGQAVPKDSRTYIALMVMHTLDSICTLTKGAQNPIDAAADNIKEVPVDLPVELIMQSVLKRDA